MSLRFRCEHCGKDIVVKYLKPGDEARCRDCGRPCCVPEDAIPTDEAPPYEGGSHLPPYPPGGGWYGSGGEYEKPPGILGPRNLGDILGEVFSAYGDEFLRFMAVAAGPTILMFVLAYIPHIYAVNVLERAGDFSLLYLLPLIPYIAIYVVVALVAGLLMEGALIHVVAARYVKGAEGLSGLSGAGYYRS